MNKYYTLIGSRKTPVNIQQKIINIAKNLRELGYIGRSGGADGADQCLEDSCYGILENCEIYLPWEGFNKKYSSNRGYINSQELRYHSEAKVIAKDVHPAWYNCSQGAKNLHTRNVFQVLGRDLKTPSEFVVYWSKYNKDLSPKGGTATAVNLANRYNIPTYNLNIDKQSEMFYLKLERIKNHEFI